MLDIIIDLIRNSKQKEIFEHMNIILSCKRNNKKNSYFTFIYKNKEYTCKRGKLHTDYFSSDSPFSNYFYQCLNKTTDIKVIITILLLERGLEIYDEINIPFDLFMEIINNMKRCLLIYDYNKNNICRLFRHLISYGQELTDMDINFQIIKYFSKNNKNIKDECKGTINFLNLLRNSIKNINENNFRIFYDIIDNIDVNSEYNKEINEVCITFARKITDVYIFNKFIEKGYDKNNFLIDKDELLEISINKINVKLMKILSDIGVCLPLKVILNYHIYRDISLEIVQLMAKDDNFIDFIEINKDVLRRKTDIEAFNFLLPYFK